MYEKLIMISMVFINIDVFVLVADIKLHYIVLGFKFIITDSVGCVGTYV